MYYDINVEGTKIALNAALEQGVEKVVYTSTFVAVGSYGADNPVNEDVEYNLWDTGNHYSRSKYLGELEAKKFNEKGLPVVIVNPTVIIGVRDIKPTPSGQLIINILNREMPGYFDVVSNIVDVEDVVRGHILAAQKGRVGERYILGGENLSMKDFFKLIAEIAGIEPPKRRIPYSLALMLGYGYQFISAITKKPPQMTTSGVRLMGKSACFDCSKAINELGIPQTPIKKTLEKSVNWFRENGYVKNGK